MLKQDEESLSKELVHLRFCLDFLLPTNVIGGAVKIKDLSLACPSVLVQCRCRQLGRVVRAQRSQADSPFYG